MERTTQRKSSAPYESPSTTRQGQTLTTAPSPVICRQVLCYPSIQASIQASIHSYVVSFTHSFDHSFVRSSIRSCIRAFVHSLACSFIHSINNCPAAISQLSTHLSRACTRLYVGSPHADRTNSDMSMWPVHLAWQQFAVSTAQLAVKVMTGLCSDNSCCPGTYLLQMCHGELTICKVLVWLTSTSQPLCMFGTLHVSI